MRKFRDKRLYQRENTAVIWARFVGPTGRIERRSTKCIDETAASAKADEFERVASDPNYAAAQATTLAAAVTAYLADKKRRGGAAATLTIAEVKMGHFARLWGVELPMLRVNAKLVADYIDKRLAEGVTRHTVYLELGHLRQLLKVATYLGTFHTPIERVIPPYFTSGHKPKDRWPTPDELAGLLPHLPKKRAAHVAYFAATGARLAEAKRAHREDTDFERRLVHIRGTKTEKADDDIPITKVNEALLRWSLANAPGKKGLLFHPWTMLHRDLAAACERAGIRKVTPNDLRRAFAKYHRLAGVDVTTVSKMLRHTTDKLAQTTYAKVSGNEVGDLANRQITAGPEGASGTVLAVYLGTAKTVPNEALSLHESSENQAPPAEVESATNALGRPSLDPRSAGNKAAWERRKARATVLAVYGEVSADPPDDPVDEPALCAPRRGGRLHLTLSEFAALAAAARPFREQSRSWFTASPRGAS